MPELTPEEQESVEDVVKDLKPLEPGEFRIYPGPTLPEDVERGIIRVDVSLRPSTLVPEIGDG